MKWTCTSVLGSRSRGLLDPEHGKDVKVGYRKMVDLKVTRTQQIVINALGSPPFGNPRGPIYRGS
jgi:hypothetical protein